MKQNTSTVYTGKQITCLTYDKVNQSKIKQVDIFYRNVIKLLQIFHMLPAEFQMLHNIVEQVCMYVLYVGVKK